MIPIGLLAPAVDQIRDLPSPCLGEIGTKHDTIEAEAGTVGKLMAGNETGPIQDLHIAVTASHEALTAKSVIGGAIHQPADPPSDGARLHAAGHLDQESLNNTFIDQDSVAVRLLLRIREIEPRDPTAAVTVFPPPHPVENAPTLALTKTTNTPTNSQPSQHPHRRNPNAQTSPSLRKMKLTKEHPPPSPANPP
ncbi:MAG: hypothetical protein Q9172_003769, partial [Xanthocarpia lactea]